MKPAGFSDSWESLWCLEEFSEVSVGETEKDEPTKTSRPETEARGWKKEKLEMILDETILQKDSGLFKQWLMEDITMIT